VLKDFALSLWAEQFAANPNIDFNCTTTEVGEGELHILTRQKRIAVYNTAAAHAAARKASFAVDVAT